MKNEFQCITSDTSFGCFQITGYPRVLLSSPPYIKDPILMMEMVMIGSKTALRKNVGKIKRMEKSRCMASKTSSGLSLAY